MSGARDLCEFGDLIQLRGETWRVARAEPYETCTVLTLEGEDQQNAGRLWRAIEPFDRPTLLRRRRPQRRRRDSVVRMALGAIAGVRPARGIWTAATAKVDLLAYQLEPALAVLGGATRVLLADEVGLGKTIQAGLILCELRARGLVDRALILTPAGLRDAWAAELRERFDLRPTVLDQAAIAAAVPGLPAGFNPWTAYPIVIASIDLVKRPEVLTAVEEAPFDMLIADEAHHFTPGSDRGAAIERLAPRTPWVVLASATPHSGDEAAFGYLTRLGDCGDRIAVFRRSRRGVGLGAGRRVHLLAVTPSASESRLLRSVESYAKAIWSGRGRQSRGARLLAIILARRAASSAIALERTLTRRLHLLSTRGDPASWQQALPWDDIDDGDGDAPAELLGLAGLENGAGEIDVIENLIRNAVEARGHPSKIRRIGRLIRRAHEPALVFTEYRDTLDALVEALGGGRRIAALHGGLPAAMRRHVVCEFNRGDLDVLIATDTAGEGLNLHHRCRLVIDVELPWNPLRLEQRVGRVDRFGQQRRVHAIRLFHRGTVEDTVLAHLERRRLRAGAAMDLETEEWLSEDEVAAAALGEFEVPQRRKPRLRSVVVEAAQAEVERLLRHRHVTSRRGARQLHRVGWSPPRHRSGSPPAMVLLSALRQLGPTGSIVGEACVALLVRPAVLPTTRRDWQTWVNLLEGHPDLEAVLKGERSKLSAEVEAQLEPLRATVRRRVLVARHHLLRSPSRELQASLFDRRVDRAAITRRLVLEQLDAALLRRDVSLTPAASAFAPHERLIAVWPFER